MAKTTNGRPLHKTGNHTLHLIVLTSCFLISSLKATIIVGDPDATTGNSFSFDVGFIKYSQQEGVGRLWMASKQSITNDAAKTYALSYAYQIPVEPTINPTTGTFYQPEAIPMANKQEAFLFSYNNTTNLVESSVSFNPIYGAGFSFFDLYATKPVFVLSSALNILYAVHDINHVKEQTATNFDKTELLYYNLGAGQETAALLGSSDGIYVAYATGVFGANPSKIAKFITSTQTQADQPKPQPYIKLIAEESVDTSTAPLKGAGSDLASLGSSVSLQGFSTMTYAGVEAEANSTAGDDTATGIMIVNTVKTDSVHSLMFSAIAPDSAISTTVNTIVSTPALGTIRIKNIAGMQTSTSLNYLIVARDSGTGPQSIYAAPLVSQKGPGYGQIADCTMISNTFATKPPTFLERTFTTPLTDPTQIDIQNTTAYTAQITVGGGAIPLAADGNISNLYVVGDSVYVVIASPYAAGTQPGTFFSQAIFAQDGHIVGWTPWARTIGSDKPMNCSTVGGTSTANYYVYDGTGLGASFKSVEQSMWTLNQNLSVLFQYSWGVKGGTQGIFNFGHSTTGFNNEISILATTGFNNVSLGQTGHTSGGNFEVKTMTNADIVSFDDVNNSTALVALELATNGTDHWLFAGGVSGLKVLVNNLGVTKTGNFTSVTDFDAGQTWKGVGDFRYIKKLIWDQTFLYVLTPTALYQISLDANKFIENPTAELNPIKIINSSEISQGSYLLDCIIDDGFCILGTTRGMYSCTIANNKATGLTGIPIPSGLPAITQLFVTSTQTQPQRNFKTLSNLYVLNNDFSNQQARINRFSIQDGNILPFNDSIINSATEPNGIPTSFIRFNQYTTNYFTDGSWNLASNYYLGTTQPTTTVSPSVLQIFASAKNGRSSSHVTLHLLSAYVPIQFLKTVNNLLGITRESTSGACIASGNFPTRINA